MSKQLRKQKIEEFERFVDSLEVTFPSASDGAQAMMLAYVLPSVPLKVLDGGLSFVRRTFASRTRAKEPGTMPAAKE